MTRCRLTVCSLLIVLATVARTHAAPAPELPPVPPADQIDPQNLNEASRAAVAAGAEYLLARISTNYMNVAVEPAFRRSIQKAYTNRYSKKMVEEPIYEYDYEDVFVTQENSSDGSRSLVKTKRIKPGSARKVGSRKVEGHVLDPNGDVVVKYPEQKHPEHWQLGFVGENALVLYALLRAGVPEDHPDLAKLAEKLREIVINCGYPDMTWDLAWLTAAFCNLQDEKFNSTRERLVNKLLDGQIVDGAGRGLWGPVCINSALFAAMIAYENDLTQELAKRKKDLEKRPDSKVLAKRIEEAEKVREEFTRQYGRVTQQGLRFEKVTEAWYAMGQNDPETAITTHGLPFYIFNQTVADIESTALALAAIREAERTGWLPKATWRPEPTKGKPILPPETPSAILARTAAALAKLQLKDGSWDEGNAHVPLTCFAALKFRPLEKKDLFAVASPQTSLSTAQAVAALLDIGQVVGMSKLLGRNQDCVANGQRVNAALVQDFLDKQVDLKLLGRFLAPYDFVLAQRGIQRSLDSLTEDRRDLRDRVAYRTLILQNSDGSWSEGLAIAHASGITAYLNEFLKQRHAEDQAKLPPEKRQPYDRNTYWSRYIGWTLKNYSHDALATCTAYSMLFLTDGLRGPLAGYVVDAPQAPCPLTLQTALGTIRREDKFDATCVGVAPDAKPAALKALPVLFVDARAAFTDPRVVSLMESYLKGPGVLAVDAADPASSAKAAARLQTLLPASRVASLTKDNATLLGMTNAPPQIQALLAADGRMAAVFLPPAGAPIACALIRKTLGPEFFLPAYPRSIAGDSPTAARVAAMDKLTGKAVEPPTPKEPAATAPAKDGAPKAPPVAVKPKPPADDDVKLPAVPAPEKKPPAADEVW